MRANEEGAVDQRTDRCQSGSSGQKQGGAVRPWVVDERAVRARDAHVVTDSQGARVPMCWSARRARVSPAAIAADLFGVRSQPSRSVAARCNTLAELVSRAKQQPGHILYGAFRATIPHLVGALLNTRTGAELGFVPSTVPRSIQDAMGGDLHIVIESAGALAGAIQSGLVKPLAVTASQRLPDLPDVPTINEAMPGIGTFDARGWMGLFAPAATPDAIVQKVSADLRAALADPQFARKLETLGSYPRVLSPGETAEYIRREQDLWRPVVRSLDLASQ